jgi:hypothetical protein
MFENYQPYVDPIASFHSFEHNEEISFFISENEPTFSRRSQRVIKEYLSLKI